VFNCDLSKGEFFWRDERWEEWFYRQSNAGIRLLHILAPQAHLLFVTETLAY
jgi:hypothetical protein